MRRVWTGYWMFGGLVGALVFASAPPYMYAQEASGLAAVAAIEQTLVEAIARSEQSVVSIARIKRQAPHIGFEDPFPRAVRGGLRSEFDADDPSNPDFIPTDFGSGVVIHVDPPASNLHRAFILTNYHVVKGGTRTVPDENRPDEYQIWVRGSNRRGAAASIYAADPRSDLAVIIVPDSELKPIKLGDGSRLKKGQLVIALGNPYAAARDGSVSASWGMVSNLRRRPAFPRDPLDLEKRKRETLHDLGDLIQVDTRLNLGTSGGALINLKGELVGLTTSLAALAGFEKSSGFAIPIDATTIRVIQTLRDGKEVEYGFLGVSFGHPAALMNFPRGDFKQSNAPEGAYVAGLVVGGPAERAGILDDDVITNVNGERVFTRDDLTREINKLGPETKAKITVWRNSGATGGGTVSVEVTLAKWGAFDEDGIVISQHRHPVWRGLVIDYSTARDKHNGEFKPFPKGVLVLKIVPPLDVSQTELVEGNRIVKVNQRPVGTPNEFTDAVKELRGDVILELDNGKKITIHE
ncbi:MAG: Serine protease [Planctomycetaceae bacterium]|nr:Serine protease [Planctomycetaceae bacterium]